MGTALRASFLSFSWWGLVQTSQFTRPNKGQISSAGLSILVPLASQQIQPQSFNLKILCKYGAIQQDAPFCEFLIVSDHQQCTRPSEFVHCSGGVAGVYESPLGETWVMRTALGGWRRKRVKGSSDSVCIQRCGPHLIIFCFSVVAETCKWAWSFTFNSHSHIL